jgi:hypothetical protein
MRDDLLRENDEIIRIGRRYLASLASRPVPRGLESGAPFSTTSRPRRAAAALGAFVAVTAIVFLVIVGLGHVVSTRQGASATPSPVRSTATPMSTPPPGEPVPSALTGDWLQIGGSPTEGPDVIFQGNKYELQTNGGTNFGMVAVNGNEIDFFNGDGCGIALPGGVGRYQWSLRSGILHLTPLGMDPCGGRTRPLANQSFTKKG